MRLVTEGETWVLPPLQAAWIPARTSHRVRPERSLSPRTVYFDPRRWEAPSLQRCAVFQVSPLAREMILASMRWGPDAPHDVVAERFFPALGALCADWIEQALPLQLPAAQTPEFAGAVAFLIDHLSEPLTLQSVARAAGLSVRTLERRFEEEAALSFREHLRRARMQAAVERLARPGTRVKSVAHAIGFSSEAAFTRAFAEVMGERPTDYQKRVRRGDLPR
jgi:transcriptional regulator GlxA family with amidase domain